jgi:hypothetical protein
MSHFDIGQADGLAIFTNNDDMFNIDTYIGPNFILDQGHDRGIADIGMTHNVTSDVIADIPNEAPIDFINYQSNGQTRSVTDLNIGNQRTVRKKMDSIVSDETIEAEPEPIKKKKSHSQQSQQQLQQQSQRSQPQPPPFQPMQKTLSHPSAMPMFGNKQGQKEPDTPPNIGINLGFDDLLDNKKLKPINDIIDDAASIGGDSQSTIRRNNDDYLSAPNSPDYRSFKPVDQAPPDSPFPTTFREDRNDNNNKRKTENRRPNNQFQQSYQEPAPQQIYEDTPKYINEDDEKMDLLLKLKSLEDGGKIILSKHYSIKSPIDDIRMEYRNQTSILESKASVNFMRKGLIFCTSGVEYMNRRFDPVGAKLDGWGESIMENMMDYDGIFERLHGKYKGSMEMEPEMELLFALMGSAFQFHLSQTFFKSAIPQLGQVLRENPAVIQSFMNVAQEASRRNTGQQQQYQQPQMPMPANDMGVGGGGYMQPPGIDFASLLGQVGITSGALSDFARTMGNPPPAPQATREYRDPPVNDLYRQMVHQDNDDALSVSSDRSIGKGSKKAVITPIPTSKRGGAGNVIKLG